MNRRKKDLLKVTISPHLLLPVTGAFQPKTWRSWWACPGCGVACMTNDPPKPGKQRRTMCLDCATEVMLVTPPAAKKSSPLKAIKSFCLECSCTADNPPEAVRDCKMNGDCPLWPFRFGKRPEKMIAQGKGELVTRKGKPNVSER